MKPNPSEVLQLVPETLAAPSPAPALAALSGSVLITGACGMAFSALMFSGGPHFGYVLAGSAGFIGCAVLVASSVITMAIAARNRVAGTDIPAAVAYAVLACGLLTMLAAAGYGASSVRMTGSDDAAMTLIASGGGFIAGAVLVAGGSIAAGFRARGG